MLNSLEKNGYIVLIHNGIFRITSRITKASTQVSLKQKAKKNNHTASYL
jgi:hypothetical protein